MTRTKKAGQDVKDLFIAIGTRDNDKIDQVARDLQPLLESAPELLEALKAIKARFDGNFDDEDLVKFGALSTSISDDVYEMAKLAIAKAEGR